MRHMADGGKGLVVCLGRHVVDPAADGLPQRRGLRHLRWAVVGQGGEDEGPVLVQRGFGMVHTRLGFASDGVGG